MDGLNMDLRETVVVDLDSIPWSPSPGGEVERRKLEREAAESGHTTSVVRYPPRSAFPAHGHPGGEEFIVLQGIFSDEHGDYPAGSYLRNPKGFAHAPRSEAGCTIFVKLCQLKSSERVVVDADSVTAEVEAEGISRRRLYTDRNEQVDLLHALDDTSLTLSNAEVLVLDGAIEVPGQGRLAQAWVRVAAADRMKIRLDRGTRLWVKRGHLPP